MTTAIEIRNLSKIYRIYANRYDRLKEWFSPSGKTRYDEFVALNNINLEIPKGQVFGIIGMNGAGKSTLLKILTGTTAPTKGTYKCTGRMQALLELGTGFHPELTGRENVIVNGKLLGFTEDTLKEKMDDIIAFCELGDFFDKTVRTYSSGMYVRLAFALASSLDPNIFVIDEALSVGDAYFQQKCLKRIRDIRDSGTTILFVSHDPSIIKVLCDEVVLLNQGSIHGRGGPQEMLEEYTGLLAIRNDAAGKLRRDTIGKLAAGNIKAQITQIVTTNAADKPANVFMVGQEAKIIIRAKFNEPLKDPTIGILVRDRVGYDVFGTNSFLLGNQTGSFAKGHAAEFTFTLPLGIGEGEYTITAAIHAADNHLEECFHWIDRAASFKVVRSPDAHFTGVCALRAELQVTRSLQ
ncbi:MAG: ABC transporter ATP-binding protein [Oligoflexales bacterium]